MAKIRTNENEEQLSVIAHLLSETQQSITELNKATHKLEQNQEVYRRFFEKSTETSCQQIKAVTSQEITAMNKISSDIKSLQSSSIQNIEKALQIALVKIEQATERKIKTAKQVYWLAGIVAIVLGITTVFLEVTRNIDKTTIAEAIQGKAEVEVWKTDLEQWMKENPKTSRHFKEWYNQKAK